MGHDIPKASLGSINEVLAGYNKTADAGETINDEDVADARDVTKDTALRQKKFFAEIGVLDKDGHEYTLTEDGDELGRLIRFNHEDEAADIYADLLADWEPTAELVAHVGEDGLSEDDLIDKVSLVTATELSHTRKKSGAGALIDLLTEAGFLTEDGGTYYASDEPDAVQGTSTEKHSTEPTPQPDVVQPDPSVERAASGGVQPAVPPAQAGGIDISLDISGSDEPENVRQLLLAIRQGAQADISKYDNGDEP